MKHFFCGSAGGLLIALALALTGCTVSPGVPSTLPAQDNDPLGLQTARAQIGAKAELYPEGEALSAGTDPAGGNGGNARANGDLPF